MNGRKTIWNKRIIWNIHLRELIVFIVSHILIAHSYMVALIIIAQHKYSGRAISVETNVNFAVKLLFIIPFYWLLFWKLRKWPLRNRLLLHVIAMPVYVALCVKVYYYVLDLKIFKDVVHLPWAYSVWDYYIGALVYLVQFGALHIYENIIQMRRQQQKEKELMKLAYQGEMNALKAQIQPHFLFNTLNSISASVPSQLERTRELIARLADTFRFALNASANESISLRDELAFTKSYLELEKERFRDRLSVNYDIDSNLLDMKVPPMLLQPIVENSLKHGIARSLTGGHINITVRQMNGVAHLEVADTGAGLTGTSKETAITKGTGLNNTNQRLQKLYGTSIRLVENIPGGVKVEFDIPTGKI